VSRSRTAPQTDGSLREFAMDLLEETLSHWQIDDPAHRRYWQTSLFEPALDVLSKPGKEFRSRILECAWELAGGRRGDQPQELSYLVELLHMGSLVIDDIEDDSELRRGQRTLHRRYGVPIALNTGNLFYFLPLSILSRLNLPPQVALAMFADISEALVLSHQGQALDLATRVTQVRQSEMRQMVTNSTRMKTGMLMRLAALLGARAAGADEDRLTLLGNLGADVGMALQMLDDWSGIHAPQRLHKGIEDIRHGRLTWPWAWLAQRCDEVRFAGLMHDAANVSIDWQAEQLIQRMRSHLREEPPAIIHDFLDGVFTQVEGKLPDGKALHELRSTLGVLERSYG